MGPDGHFQNCEVPEMGTNGHLLFAKMGLLSIQKWDVNGHCKYQVLDMGIN